MFFSLCCFSRYTVMPLYHYIIWMRSRTKDNYIDLCLYPFKKVAPNNEQDNSHNNKY